jgi:succinyl-CoA synthetase beta subunit
VAQLHENQAKRILAAHGIQIPRGKVATTGQQAALIAAELGGEVVVKAQIHTTSRAAAGGIRFASDANETAEIAGTLLGHEIAGNLIDLVLIDEKLQIEREFYLGFIIDDRLKRPILLFSEAGGSGIETRAGLIKRLVCSIKQEPTVAEIERELLGDVKPAEIVLQLADVAQRLYRAARSCEARTAEINPLALLPDGRMLAADARISVDDSAVYRHPELGIEMARELGHSPTELERIAWEIERDDFRGTFYFVEILGETARESLRIGFHGAGGGGSMASLDAAQRNGLHPACYVDTSGNPPASKVYRAARIILSLPGIRGYFLSGSGVASQEQYGLARAVLKAFLEVRPRHPGVLRLGGNGEDLAKELVERYAPQLPAPLEAYRKQDSADFCATRLHSLITDFEAQTLPATHAATRTLESNLTHGSAAAEGYSFETRTGMVTFDHALLNPVTSEQIVNSCPQKILTLNPRGRPELGVEREAAKKGKCTECLACEFASLEQGLGAVKIEFPIPGLDS